jgi:hypothetical protein
MIDAVAADRALKAKHLALEPFTVRAASPRDPDLRADYRVRVTRAEHHAADRPLE